MQEQCIDYYEKEGCCMSCKDKAPGCLCYECKCKACFHYTPPQRISNSSPSGECDVANELRIQKLVEKRAREKSFKDSVIDYTKGVDKDQKQLVGFDYSVYCKGCCKSDCSGCSFQYNIGGSR
jgi:hypothetical protein